MFALGRFVRPHGGQVTARLTENRNIDIAGLVFLREKAAIDTDFLHADTCIPILREVLKQVVKQTPTLATRRSAIPTLKVVDGHLLKRDAVFVRPAALGKFAIVPKRSGPPDRDLHMATNVTADTDWHRRITRNKST